MSERDWTQDHYVTRNSTTDDPTGYRVWMTCRCGWDSGTLPDGNIPTTHRAELEHYVRAAAVAEQGEWEWGLRLDEREEHYIYAHKTLDQARKMAALNSSREPSYYRRRKAGPWEEMTDD